MKHRIMTGMLSATLAATAMATVKDSPYNVIIARNSFGLRPIPVVVEKAPEPPPAPPAPEIKITGITTLLGVAMVTLQYEDKETKKTEFPPLLREGERYKKLFVERIDTEKQLVVIRNGDALATLDFVHNGVKPTGGVTAMASASPTPNAFPPVVSGLPNDSRVIIGNPPTVRPPMTPEQARAYAEMQRRKQLAEQGGTGAPLPPAFPQPGNPPLLHPR